MCMKKKILAIIVQVNQWINERPIVKRTVGVILVLLGLAALITPITPAMHIRRITPPESLSENSSLISI